MPTIIDCIQGSDEWFAARLGKVTASEFHEVLNKKSGRKTYMYKLAAEVLSGMTQETYNNAVMERGKELESEAREYYSILLGREIIRIGFVEKDEWIGASPDGFVVEEGLIETKCPNSTTHIQNIITGKIPTKYIPQVQGQLWVTGRKWCDYVSYDPRITTKPFFCVRVERDEEYIKNLEAETNVFVAELKELISKVKADTF